MHTHFYTITPRVCKLLNVYPQTCIVFYILYTLCDTYFSNTRDLCERKTTFSIVSYETVFIYMQSYVSYVYVYTYGNVRYMFAQRSSYNFFHFAIKVLSKKKKRKKLRFEGKRLIEKERELLMKRASILQQRVMAHNVEAGACQGRPGYGRLASERCEKQVMVLKCIRQLLAMNTDMNTRGGRGGHVRSRPSSLDAWPRL